jgi:hypothetical protein
MGARAGRVVGRTGSCGGGRQDGGAAPAIPLLLHHAASGTLPALAPDGAAHAFQGRVSISTRIEARPRGPATAASAGRSAGRSGRRTPLPGAW